VKWARSEGERVKMGKIFLTLSSAKKISSLKVLENFLKEKIDFGVLIFRMRRFNIFAGFYIPGFLYSRVFIFPNDGMIILSLVYFTSQKN